jgi:hypothetical protein
MNLKPIFITAVLSATLLAGCDQGADRTGAAPVTPPPPTVTQNREQPQATPPAVQGSQTPPTVAERKAGDEPVQGQVDTKEPAQRRTFEAPKG